VATLRNTKDGGPVVALLNDEEKLLLVAGRLKQNDFGFVDCFDGQGNFKGGVGGGSLN
jgi:hypothetical protein